MAEIGAYIFLIQNDICTADGYIFFSVHFIKYTCKNMFQILMRSPHILSHDQIAVLVTHFSENW
jgi:hypothetical protein